MSYPVKETPCTRCDHSQVCVYKDDFMSVIEAVGKARVTKETPDGKCTRTQVMDFDFVGDIQVTCKYVSHYRQVYERSAT